MNNEKQQVYLKYIAIFLTSLLFIYLLLQLVIGGNGAINPTKSADENPSAGLDYAVLFNQGEFYSNLAGDDENLRLVQEDLKLFARTTIPALSSQDTLVGFTFNDSFSQEGSTYTHSGYFYSSPDEIEVRVTTYETGVVTLSITNTKDQTNIDESLNLNGSKNKIVVSLPIDTDFYSVRYSKIDDKIVAAFYLGYTEKHVDEVVKILNNSYGGVFDESDVIFNVNSVGIFNLDGVRNYSSNPANQL